MSASTKAALFSEFSPQQIQQLMGLGSVDERSQLMAKQGEQARALSTRPQRTYSNPVAGTLGGVASGLEGIGSAIGDYSSFREQQKLLDQQDALRKLFAQGGTGQAPNLPQPDAYGGGGVFTGMGPTE